MGLARVGLAAFVARGLAPLATAIGEAWLDGRLAVYEEHLFSEAVQSVLRSGMLPFQTGLEASAPRLLLTTVPGEADALGLLMAEALLTLEACPCLSLGVQTPVDEIAAAARAPHRRRRAQLHREPARRRRARRAGRPARPAAGRGGDLGRAAARGRPARSEARPGPRHPRLADIPEAVADWRRDGGPTAN